MKRIVVFTLVGAALSGCVVVPRGPSGYASPAITRAPQDPYQWQVVSVEPVRRDESGKIIAPPEPTPQAQDGIRYAAQPVYAPAPVYLPQPIVVQPPLYAAPNYYPYFPLFPLALGLGFEFGRVWHGGHRHGHRGHHRGR